jgi:hypothetical protein
VPVPLVAPPAEAAEPTHLPGILAEIVGTEMSCQGRSCEMHKICGEVLTEDAVVRLKKFQLMVEGKVETAIAEMWVMDGINRCHDGFVPCHMVKHSVWYNGALAQVTCIFSGDPETCNSAERCLFFKNKGFCLASIIFILPGRV